MFEFSKEWAEPYWRGRKKHKNWQKAVDVYHHISFHFDGYFQRPWITEASSMASADPTSTNPYFNRLIDEKRPGESDTIRAYRRNRYMPVTKVPCGKVLNSLKKIVKSADWHIDYDKSENPPSLPEDMTAEKYFEKEFPFDDSVENWAYRKFMRWMLIDPNGMICVMPLSWEVANNELFRPYPHIIQSKDVLDYKEGEYAVFVSPYVNPIHIDNTTINGKIIMVVTTDSYYELKQTDKQGQSFEIVQHVHNIGEIPAWIIGGESKSADVAAPFYESYLHPMLPSLDSAASDLTDLDAEKIQHLFSTMWVVQTQSCNNCSGGGQIIKDGAQIVCPVCDGRGSMPFSPYRTLEINPNSTLRPDQAIPTPPVGYVTKPTEMVKLMMEIIKQEIYDALAAINMEFLAETPQNASGLSKEVDRDELNNFVYGIAYHLVVECLEPVYYFCNELRYMALVPDRDKRKKMLPKVNVPQSYDFLTSKDAEDNLIKITNSEVSPDIKEAAEMDFIHVKFQDNPEVRDRLVLIHDHNPLPGYSSTEIVTLVNSGRVLPVDATLALYIKTFVSQLLAEDRDFCKLSFDEQKQKLYEMAELKTEELDTATQIKQMADAANQVPDKGQQPSDAAKRMRDKVTGEKPRKKERSDLTNA